MIAQPVMAHWQEMSWVAFDELIDKEQQDRLAAWVDDVATEPEVPETRLHYYEATDRGPKLCRTERFLEDHAGLRALITGPQLTGIAAMLLDEAAVLYKEKINYKHADGAGYAAHQDATAYSFVKRHVTCLIAVDPMTRDNGCLEFATGRHLDLLKRDEQGCIDPEIAAALNWEPVPLPAGGVIFFSSLAPHRSGPNRSGQSRRALYLTYNARAEGDLREAYYEERSRAMAMATAGGAPGLRISTIGHFQGAPVGSGSGL